MVDAGTQWFLNPVNPASPNHWMFEDGMNQIQQSPATAGLVVVIIICAVIALGIIFVAKWISER